MTVLFFDRRDRNWMGKEFPAGIDNQAKKWYSIHILIPLEIL